jgi:hypothetical protein
MAYTHIHRWKFPIGRGVGFDPIPLKIGNPMEFPKGSSNQMKT